MIPYIINKNNSVVFSNGTETLEITPDEMSKIIKDTNEIIDQISHFPVNVFEVLGMRNLSAFIGELLVATVVKNLPEKFAKNPHQDGYPDLLALTGTGKKHWDEVQKLLRHKEPFSPFKTGGIEVKATCGNVPSATAFQKIGLEKPAGGDCRVKYLKTYEWKAHHRETNNLLGIFWDYFNGIPRICALFYSGNLSESDWGEIIRPKDGGGRTTSVSLMNRAGVKKMYDGWLVAINEASYINFFNAYNKSDLIPLPTSN